MSTRYSSMNTKQPIYLQEIALERWWPTLPIPVLALMELKQDPLYSFLDERKIGDIIDQAIHYGKQAAKKMEVSKSPAQMIDQVIHSGVRIRFTQKATQHNQSIRAQYRTTPPTIDVYRHSLQELMRFFQKTGFHVRQEEIITLHVVHEWFHHMETSHWGRTDLKLPQVSVPLWGPIYKRRPLKRLREIAAHAFTQEIMGLPWSPLLLDHLLLLIQHGQSKQQIREHFSHLNSQYQMLLASQK